MIRYLIALLLVSCTGLCFLYFQDMDVSSFDDASIMEDVQSGAELDEPGRIPVYPTLSPRIANRLMIGQTFSSVTNMLGVPPLTEPILILGTQYTSTNRWYVVYMHSQSNSVYYRMLFSGENARPARLLTVEEFRKQGEHGVSTGVLPLVGSQKLGVGSRPIGVSP